MQPNSSLRRVGPGILVGGTAGIATTILTLAIGGSVFFQGNVVGDTAKNANPSFIAGVRAIMTPAIATSTATGGLAKYDTIYLSSPYNSTASTRGLRTGSGVYRYLQLDIVANPTGAQITCTKVKGVHTATGGTVLLSGTATGSIATYSTPVVTGPTEGIKCGMGTNPKSAFSAVLRGIAGDSDVTN